MKVCDTKVMYDTEMEATIVAAHHSDDMEPYECGNTFKHWHLTHRKREQRIGIGRARKYGKCRDCGKIMRRVNLPRHNCKAKKS